MNLAFYKNRKVFITGHTGFKGSWLAQILHQNGAIVTGYSLNPPTQPNLFSKLHLDKKINSVIGDVRDFDTLLKAIQDAQPEIVFHLAAQPLVRESYRLPRETYDVNVMGTVNLLDAIRNCSCVKSVVNVTTDKVYENKEWCYGYRENENLCGLDPYSNSKSCSELITHSYIQSFFHDQNSIAISTARSGNVIGGGDFSKDRIIPDCIRAALKGESIIVRNPNSIRPYQHVLDCLSGYLLLAKLQYEDQNYQGSYNFGPNDNDCINTGALVTLFCNSWKENCTWVNQNDNGPHEANFLKLDCSKAKSILNWEHRWNIQTAIEKTIEVAKMYDSDHELELCIHKQIYDYFK